MPFATIHGARLWFEDLGSAASGPPVLLHHGYTASRVNWMPVAERLRADHRVILMECRGAGDSEHTTDGYTLAQFAADVVGLLDHLEIERVTYAGHSMGGGIGYVLGLEHAARLERLVLVAPIPADGVGAIDPDIRAERIAERERGDREAVLTRHLGQNYRQDVLTPAWFESRVDHVLGCSDGHFIGGFETMQALNVLERLGQLATPTLMVAGMADGLLPANLRDFGLLPNAALEVYATAGHEIPLCEADRLASTLRFFVREGVITAQTLMERQIAAGTIAG